MQAGGIAPRTRTGTNLGCMPVGEFVTLLRQDCRSVLKTLI
jgi:hypothetical protein